jgi:hypothetical protein
MARVARATNGDRYWRMLWKNYFDASQEKL